MGQRLHPFRGGGRSESSGRNQTASSSATVREFFYAVAQDCPALRVGECSFRSCDDTALSKTQSRQRVAENRRDRVMQIDSVMRVSGHRFQMKVTISVPLRCSARPQRSLRFHGPRSLRARQLRDRGADRVGPLWLRSTAALRCPNLTHSRTIRLQPHNRNYR